MCLMCEQEDLYFLYLARVEQARRAALGEPATPNPHWMWSGGTAPAATAPSASPNASSPAPAPAPSPRAEAKSAFVCDAPE